MTQFNIAKIGGEFEHQGELHVTVLGDQKDGFGVALCQGGGPMRYQFMMRPEQSARLRAALEEAEGKAEILTAAI